MNGRATPRGALASTPAAFRMSRSRRSSTRTGFRLPTSEPARRPSTSPKRSPRRSGRSSAVAGCGVRLTLADAERRAADANFRRRAI